MQTAKITAQRLRRANMKYRTTIADKIENANQRAKTRLRKERTAHFKAIERDPFFKKILSKKIPFRVHPQGEQKNYTLLGTGFEGEGNFRRTVLLIDEKGRTTFWGESMRGLRTNWTPYRIVKETIRWDGKKNYIYSELDSLSRKYDDEVSEASHNIKYYLDQVTFEKADIKKMDMIRKFM